jgi:hypothetical protein
MGISTLSWIKRGRDGEPGNPSALPTIGALLWPLGLKGAFDWRKVLCMVFILRSKTDDRWARWLCDTSRIGCSHLRVAFRC